jgi:hypothetical protein
MHRKSLLSLALAGACLVGLAGCYESPNVTLYEPGEYKGKEDPLLTQAGSAQHEQELRERLLSGQTDR